MLAFTRRPNESFIIGQDIVIKVLGRDSHGNVQFGIEVAKSEPTSIDKLFKEHKEKLSQQG